MSSDTDWVTCPLCGNTVQIQEDAEALDYPRENDRDIECPSCHATLYVTEEFSYSVTMYARVYNYSIDEFEQEDIDSWPDGEKEAYSEALQKWEQEQRAATMKRLGVRQETLFE